MVLPVVVLRGTAGRASGPGRALERVDRAREQAVLLAQDRPLVPGHPPALGNCPAGAAGPARARLRARAGPRDRAGSVDCTGCLGPDGRRELTAFPGLMA